MAQDIDRSRGRPHAYKPGSGGTPSEPGPFIGIVKNNEDATHSGKIDVYIEYLSGPDPSIKEYWRTVSYISPFYGHTPAEPPESGEGKFDKNRHSYGMWMTPPDLETRVICFFAEGDPNQGYYMGAVVEPDSHHMVPAIASTSAYVPEGTPCGVRLPTVEINHNNAGLADSAQFYNQKKPIHKNAAAILYEQGLLTDEERGVINSSSYRESPSTVYGISTPGRAIMGGGEPPKVIAREGGHSFVMDDGDKEKKDQLIRIRSANGHQILLSDTAESLYIIHSNGQTWIELGKEGTIDMFAVNSINLRTQGEINMHADKDINIHAKRHITQVADEDFNIEGKNTYVVGVDKLHLFSKKLIRVKSNGTMHTQTGGNHTTLAGGNIVEQAGGLVLLNSGGGVAVPPVEPPKRNELPDVYFDGSCTGWKVVEGAIVTITSRAPSHEPWPLHNTGVVSKTDVASPPPSEAEPAPAPAATAATANAASLPPASPSAPTISDVDFANQPKTASSPIGSISPDQVNGMLAQAAKQTGQAPNVASDALGLGKHGLTPDKLEELGYVKPGISDFINQTGASPMEVLDNPDVWSNIKGATDMQTVLKDPDLQDRIKLESMENTFSQMKEQGLVSGKESPSQLAGLLNSAENLGTSVLAGLSKSASNISEEVGQLFNNFMEQGRYAAELVDKKVSPMQKKISQDVKSGTNMTETGKLDAAIQEILKR